MPPKEKTEAEKAIDKKKAAAKRAKNKAEKEKVHEVLGPVPRKLPVRATTNEDKIRLFFKQLQKTHDSDVELKNQIQIFSQSLNMSEKKIFQNLLINLPKNLYRKLIQDYLNQSKSFNIFWESYKTVSLRDIMFENAQKEEDEDDEKEEVVRSFKPLPLPQEPKRYPSDLLAKVREFNDYNELLPQQFKKPVDIKFFGDSETLVIEPFVDYIKINKDTPWPWIKNLTEIYVASANEKSNIEKAFEGKDSVFILKDGFKWYKINDRFNNIISKSRRYWNSDETVKLVKRDSTVLFVKFAYKVQSSDDLIMQTKSDFEKEKKYIKQFNLTKNDKIKLLMSKDVDTKVTGFAKTKLTETLTIKSEDGDTQPNTEYISKIIQEMAEISNNIEDFLNILANLLVFLKKKDSVFFERVIEEYYIPEILCTLSEEEKLPEIFENPENETEKRETKRILVLQISSQKSRLKESLYNIIYPTDRVDTDPQKVLPSYTVSKGWKSVCENKQDVESVQNASIVYYTEDQKVYCLNIWDIYDQIRKGEKPINITTGQQLDKAFVKRIKELYDSNKFTHSTILEEEKMEPLPSVEKESSSHKKEVYAPGLLEMIIKNIRDCEYEIEGDSGLKKCKSFEDDEDIKKVSEEEESEDNESKAGSKAGSDDDESDVKSDDDESDDEKDDDESDDEKDDDESDVEKDDESKTGSDKSDDESDDFPKFRSGGEKLLDSSDSSYKSAKLDNPSDNSSDSSFKSAKLDNSSDLSSKSENSDSSVNSPASNKTEIKKGNICQYCGKKIKTNYKFSHKTKIETEENKYQTIYFCKLPAKCFENYDFPDYKFKKGKVKGKGRCSSADRKKK